MGETVNPLHAGMTLARWQALPFREQMANIGSEVGRALNWRKKGREDFSQKALLRGLELLDFTIAEARHFPRLKELLRVKEGLLDFFYGTNEYASSMAGWQKYFHYFNYAARRRR